VADRLALLSLEGSGAERCEGCAMVIYSADIDGHAEPTCPIDNSIRWHHMERLPACLSAERAAARLLAVEVAARRLLDARANASACIENDAWTALRAALKE
jgi:hypothetical protein